MTPQLEKDTGGPSQPVSDSGTWLNPQEMRFNPEIGRMEPSESENEQNASSARKRAPSAQSGSWERPESMRFNPLSGKMESSASENELGHSPLVCARVSNASAQGAIQPHQSKGRSAAAPPAAPMSPPLLTRPASSSPSQPIPGDQDGDPTSGSWANPIPYEPVFNRRKPAPSGAILAKITRKRRPSPPTSQAEDADVRIKTRRTLPPESPDTLHPLRDLASTGQLAVPLKRLGPSWKTHSVSPAPPVISKEPSVGAIAPRTEAGDQHMASQDSPFSRRNVYSAAQAVVEAIRTTPQSTGSAETTALPHFSPLEFLASNGEMVTAEGIRMADDDVGASSSAVTLTLDTDLPNTTPFADTSMEIDPDPMSSFDIPPLPSADLVLSTEPEHPAVFMAPEKLALAKDPMASEKNGSIAPLPTSEAVPSNASPSLSDQQSPSNILSEVSPMPSSSLQQVEQAVEDVREGVADVRIQADSGLAVDVERDSQRSPSIEEITVDDFSQAVPQNSSRIPSRSARFTRNRQPLYSRQKRIRTVSTDIGQTVIEIESPQPLLHLGRFENMSRAKWRALVEREALSDIDTSLDTDGDSPPSSRSAGLQGVEDHLNLSVMGQPLHESQQTPDDRRGTAKREFNAAQVDDWNHRLPTLTRNPALHRAIFEAFVSEKELESGVITVSNKYDGAPPDLEFEYGNDMLYHPDVPDPELGLGCNCVGPCDPKSTTCTCLKRQKAYFYDDADAIKGFAYDE